jgi:hypothetical protein
LPPEGVGLPGLCCAIAAGINPVTIIRAVRKFLIIYTLLGLMMFRWTIVRRIAYKMAMKLMNPRTPGPEI